MIVKINWFIIKSWWLLFILYSWDRKLWWCWFSSCRWFKFNYVFKLELKVNRKEEIKKEKLFQIYFRFERKEMKSFTYNSYSHEDDEIRWIMIWERKFSRVTWELRIRNKGSLSYIPTRMSLSPCVLIMLIKMLSGKSWV